MLFKVLIRANIYTISVSKVSAMFRECWKLVLYLNRGCYICQKSSSLKNSTGKSYHWQRTWQLVVAWQAAKENGGVDWFNF